MNLFTSLWNKGETDCQDIWTLSAAILFKNCIIMISRNCMHDTKKNYNTREGKCTLF